MMRDDGSTMVRNGLQVFDSSEKKKNQKLANDNGWGIIADDTTVTRSVS